MVVPGGLEKSLCLAHRSLFQKNVGHTMYAAWAEELRRRFRDGERVRIPEFLVEMNETLAATASSSDATAAATSM